MAGPLAVALTARPSYTKLKPILTALLAEPTIPGGVTVLACASALLTKYGRVVDQVRHDFPGVPIEELYSVLEGDGEHAAGAGAGLLGVIASDALRRIRPSAVVVMADRYETLACTLSARLHNIPIAHIQGGEISGNVDDAVRNANTMLATWHFPSTEKAAERVRALTGSRLVWNYGCPSIDIAASVQSADRVEGPELWGYGIGAEIDPTREFALVLQHSETDHPELAYEQLLGTYRAVEHSGLPGIFFWPGPDPGQDSAAKALRTQVNQYGHFACRFIRTMPPERFLKLVSQATVMVGNSSCGIREAPYFGTPVVDIGARQLGRERGRSVVSVDTNEALILAAIAERRTQSFAPDYTYGTGHAGLRIATRLKELTSVI